MSGYSWEIGADQEFLNKVEELQESEGDLYNNIKNKIEKIKEDPLTGDPKTGLLKGSRTVHVEHLVLRWEVRPEVHRRKHLEKIDEVYFLCITHHDDMKEGFSSKNPATISEECVIEFGSYNVGSELHQLYNLDFLQLQEPNWHEDGVEVRGTVEKEDREKLESKLPADASIRYTEDQII